MLLGGLAFVLGAVLQPAVTLPDVNGVNRRPFMVAGGRIAALFFIAPDCPISNYYAREIRRVCDEYGKRGLDCTLVYADPNLSDASARAHAGEYGHGDYPWIVDRKHVLVKQTGVTVTPEVAVIKSGGQIVYRGRIDDFYVTWGKSRRQVSERNLRDALDAILAGKAPATAETKSVGCYISDLKTVSE